MAEIPATPLVATTPRRWPMILFAVLVSILVSGVGLLWMQGQLETALAVRPPVVVLDLAGAARETDPAQLAALLDAYRTTAERLAGRGLLVLERQAVLAAPAGLTLSDREVRHATP